MRQALPILVAYDGSVDADQALVWAADEASGVGAPIRVVIIDEVVSSEWDDNVLVRGGPEVLARAEKALQDAGMSDSSVERHSGHVVPELLAMAESASMLVVGSQGHGRVGEALIGSVSQHLARHAACSVVVVREPPTPEPKRIVVGVDGSPTSNAAIEFACRRAERLPTDVAALHGWKVHTPSTDMFASDPRSIDLAQDKELLLAESVAGVRAAHPDVELLQEAIPVAPAQILVDASAVASLVVVGSRGRGFFSGLLLGSVSQEVVQRAHCSVAVIR